MTSGGSTRSMSSCNICFEKVWEEIQEESVMFDWTADVIHCEEASFVLKQQKRTYSLVCEEVILHIPLFAQTHILLHRGCCVRWTTVQRPKASVSWNSNNFKCPLKEWSRPGSCKPIVAGVLTRLKAQRTTVQFKEVSEKATIQAEAADISIPHVIPGQGKAPRNTCKVKGAVPHQWLKTISYRVWRSFTKPVCTSSFLMLIFRSSRGVFQGKGNLSKIKNRQYKPWQMCQSRMLEMSMLLGCSWFPISFLNFKMRSSCWLN